MKTAIQKEFLLALILGAALFIASTGSGQSNTADGTDSGTGISTSGQYGIYRLLLPESPRRHLSLVLNGGYGFIESMGPVSGTHHRLQGEFSIGGSPVSWLGISMSLDGYRDAHPTDAEGKDTTAIGAPSLLLRAGHRLGNIVQLGAECQIFVPGSNAPSIEFSATTAEPSLLFAVAPKTKRWSMLASAGFRFDNSANIAPASETLRPGDRISLNISDFNAVLLRLGAGFSIKKADLFAEFSADILVGNSAPVAASPLRLALGGRYAVTKGLDIFLLAEPLLGKRPNMSLADKYAPTPPRFSILAGIAYTFNFDKTPEKSSSDSDDTVETSPAPTPVQPPSSTETTHLSGRVQDEDANPVGGASVTVSANGKSFTAETDAEGAYFIDNLPLGKGTLTIETGGFTPLVQEIYLTLETVNQPPNVLIRPPLGTAAQLKGLVRSITGTPLAARITIDPGGISIRTDQEGYFVENLAEGTYTVKISAPGFRTQKKTIQMETAGVTILNVDLTPEK